MIRFVRRPIARRRRSAAPAAARAAANRQPTHDAIQERILELVVEKTGYPKDMLDLDLDLEADLGVDTVKQAEMFAAIRDSYNIPRDENLKLRDFPTLAHVIRFVHDRPGRTVPAPPAAPPAVADSGDRRSREKNVLDLVVEKTGYPKDMLDLDLDLEADLGVDTVKQAEMFAAIRETYNIPRDRESEAARFPNPGARDPVRQTGAGSGRCPRRRLRPADQSRQPADDPVKDRCWRSWPKRPAIRKTCWTWISIWKRISASTPSSRRRCSPPCAQRSTSRAIRI